MERVEELSRGVRSRTYQPKELIVGQGIPASGVYIIASGSVEVSADAENGSRYVIRYAGPQHAVGLLSTLDGKGCPHSYRAHQESLVLWIEKAALFSALTKDSSLWPSVLGEINHRYRFALQQIAQQALEPLRVRLARTLLTLVEAYGLEQQDGTLIQLHLAQDQLGDLLGVSRQSANKLIKGLECEGIIQMHYGRVVVRDVEALRENAYAGGWAM